MSLIRNASFNFLGAAVPAILSILTTPFIITRLGNSDYGVLTLVTTIVGYFALLDINVTAGSTKYLSEYFATGDVRNQNETIYFGLLIYGVIGLIGMAGIFFSSRFLVDTIFSIPPTQHENAIIAIKIAALGFFTGQVQAYIQTIPGALMRFDIGARVEAIFGTIVPSMTVVLLILNFGLVELVWLRVFLSFVQSLILWFVIKQLIPDLQWIRPGKQIRQQLISFSAYSFLSKLASLTYAHVDKLIISAKVSIEALTFYVVPTTLTNRVMSLVFRFSSVMFPYASAMAAQKRIPELRQSYLHASRYIFLINGFISLTLAIFAYPILACWLNQDFAQKGAIIMSLIAISQWSDSLTNLPSFINDGFDHPKVTGLFALCRAFIGIILIFCGVKYYGSIGAAYAHLIASIIMAITFIIYVHGRTVPIKIKDLCQQSYFPTMLPLISITILSFVLEKYSRNGWLELTLALTALVTTFVITSLTFTIDSNHRKKIFRWIRQAAS